MTLEVLKCRVRTERAEQPHRNCVFINTNGQICKDCGFEVLAGTTNFKPNNLHLTITSKEREERGNELIYGEPVLAISIMGIGIVSSTFVGIMNGRAKLADGSLYALEDVESIVATTKIFYDKNDGYVAVPKIPFAFVEKYRDRGQHIKHAGVQLNAEKEVALRPNGTCIMAKADACYESFAKELLESPIGRSFMPHIIQMMEDNNIPHEFLLAETKRKRTRIVRVV